MAVDKYLNLVAHSAETQNDSAPGPVSRDSYGAPIYSRSLQITSIALNLPNAGNLNRPGLVSQAKLPFPVQR